MSPSNSNLKKKAVRGGFSYLIRSIVTTLVQVLSNLLIMLWLSPKDFGYFATINLIIGIAQILADGGLSVYLIQRKEETTDRDLSHIASLQLISYAIAHIAVLIILTAQYFIGYDIDIILYIFCSLFLIPLNILRANSFVNLERSMAFDKVAVIEIAESLIYSSFSLVLAFWGYGVWSLILAAVLKSLAGYVIAYSYCKWQFSFIWPHVTDEIKRAVKFGISYHIPALVTTLRLAINPILIGSILGLGAVGIADRANYYAGLPLFFLGAIQQRVLFPYFSRIQDDSNLVRVNFEKSYYLSAIIDKIIFIPMTLFAAEIITLYVPQWKQTIPLIYIGLIGNILFGSFSHSSYPVLNGLGKSDKIAVLSVLSMIITWVCTWPLVKYFGLVGYAYVGLIIWVLITLPSILILKRAINGFLLWRPMLIPVGSFILSCLIITAIRQSFIMNVPLLIGFSMGAILLYFLFLVLMDGRYIMKMFISLRTALSNS